MSKKLDPAERERRRRARTEAAATQRDLLTLARTSTRIFTALDAMGAEQATDAARALLGMPTPEAGA